VYDMSNKGYTLIEVLISLTLFAIIATIFMQGLNVGISGTYRDSQMNTALHLSQSQMEYIKSQEYDEESPFIYGKIDDLPPGFTADDIEIDVTNIGDIPMNEMQQITVTVTYDEDRTITVAGYKINR